MKLEKTCFSDLYRIVDEDWNVLAMCEKYANGFWAVHDKDNNRKLCRPIHQTPTKAMRWFEGRFGQMSGFRKRVDTAFIGICAYPSPERDKQAEYDLVVDRLGVRAAAYWDVMNDARSKFIKEAGAYLEASEGVGDD